LRRQPGLLRPVRADKVPVPAAAAGSASRAQQDTDPLGRPLRGRDYGDDYTVKVPGEIDVQRARRIVASSDAAVGTLSAYAATKGAIDTLVKYFSAALGPRGRRHAANCLTNQLFGEIRAISMRGLRYGSCQRRWQ
jgi:NAD(P)-dependent dehydrogenase (short-subunit alcohol dehydrogenase family)